MVASISLYRGSLHKPPRRLLSPAPKISLKDFKILLRRRQRALSRLTEEDDDEDLNSQEEEPHNHHTVSSLLDVKLEEVAEGEEEEGDDVAGVDKKVVEGGDVAKVDRRVVGGDDVADFVREVVGGDDVANVDREVVGGDDVAKIEGYGVEVARKEEDVSDKQKRRQEIEEKLKVLNAKKHGLVQALKQIINAEEELKRRNTQGVSGQPPIGGGQVEGTHDSGSMSRDNTPKRGSEGNGSGEAEGAETDGAKHNVHLHHLVRMSSTSPSSDIQQHKSPFTKATLPSRTNSGVANSPSRFALAGQQGLPPNLPSVSVSGTNYVASSPSPAASGGTSAFRDGRGPSPWN